MADATQDDLVIPALSALAASSNGGMTRADLVASLETRQGPTDEAASDAQSPEARTFADTVASLLAPSGTAGSLVTRGFATLDESGGFITITPEGRRFIGR